MAFVGDQTPDHRLSTYKDIMLNQQLTKEQRALQAEIAERGKTGTLRMDSEVPTKRRRWDQPTTDVNGTKNDAPTPAATPSTPSKRWGDDALTPSRPPSTLTGVSTPGSRSQWDDTPGRAKDPGATPGQSVRQWSETPHFAATPGRETGSSAFGVSIETGEFHAAN